MDIVSVYADYEIHAKVVVPPDPDRPDDMWVELCVRHAVTGEVVFLRQGAYVCADGGTISPKQALYSATRHAEQILARKLGHVTPSKTA